MKFRIRIQISKEERELIPTWDDILATVFGLLGVAAVLAYTGAMHSAHQIISSLP